MEKQNIFKHVDSLYTKLVECIIGEIPIDGSPEDITQKETREKNPPKGKIVRLKEGYLLGQEKALNLGKSNDSSLLYSEVVKKEKKETENIDDKIILPKVTKEPSSDTKTNTVKEKTLETRKKQTVTTKIDTKETTKKNDTTQKDVTKQSSKKSTKKSTKVSSDKPVEKVAKKPVDNKPKASSTKTPKPKSTKRADKIAFYIKDIKKYYGEVDEAFVATIVKNLGPAIYNKHAELVSCVEHKELETVRKNFLINKLGIDASRGVLDAAIQDVCEELEDAPKKYRATFYYALAKKFKKESVLS
ncbi:MAG: Unknown protein [uncultured Sulfurovum sp.]|uniref:DUF2853 family protein n=1 Tax=uncultured Sulfurovum sp. TaxID=269237 RepID=A0A6S6T0Z9_9BACT|nr:MAG: Unknown protein [uncultured Sulfurovum sp.]